MSGLTGTCGEFSPLQRKTEYDLTTLGNMPLARVLFSVGRHLMGNVRFLVIEGGSIIAVVGGFLSYLHGDTLVGNGGMLLGLAGIITAATPIIQGWIVMLREERKQRSDRLAIPDKVRENEAAIEFMKEELADLRKGIIFKRELIEQQQNIINMLVARVGSIEDVAAKVHEVVSAIQAEKTPDFYVKQGLDEKSSNERRNVDSDRQSGS